MRVIRQTPAVTLLLHTQQHLDVLAVLIAAGLLVALHPRLDLVLPQRWVLSRLLLWSCTLKEKTNTGNLTDIIKDLQNTASAVALGSLSF